MQQIRSMGRNKGFEAIQDNSGRRVHKHHGSLLTAPLFSVCSFAGVLHQVVLLVRIRSISSAYAMQHRFPTAKVVQGVGQRGLTSNANSGFLDLQAGCCFGIRKELYDWLFMPHLPLLFRSSEENTDCL